MTPFDGKCRYLQASFFPFLIFAKVRPVRKKVIDKHRDRHADIQIEAEFIAIEFIAIDEIL